MQSEYFTLVSKENEIINFIDNDENTQEILSQIQPQLKKHFPDSKISLEISDNLERCEARKINTLKPGPKTSRHKI